MRNQFIEIIKSDSLVMAQKWAEVVSGSKYTKTYRKLGMKELTRLGKDLFDNLGRWLDPKISPKEVGNIYSDIGAKRYEQGYPLCELHYAVHYTKKVVLGHIFSESVLPDTLKLYQIYEFILEIYDFFDLAVFYETRGFHEALYKKILSIKGVNKEHLKKAFPEGSFYYEMEPDFKSFEKALGGFNLFSVKSRVG